MFFFWLETWEDLIKPLIGPLDYINVNKFCFFSPDVDI